MKKADNFDAKQWLIENKITFQSRLNENKIPGVDVEVDDDMITLSSDSGDYDGFIEDDGTVSFTVTNDEEDFNDQNWKDILGNDHVFVKVANAIDTKVEAMGDYVMITVKADDLTSMNESRLNENEDLAAKIAALPDFNTAMDSEKSELVVGKYVVVRYDDSEYETGQDMFVVWDNTVNQDEIGSYDDENHIQKLVGLISLCPFCHMTKHIGRSISIGAEKICYNQMAKVNKWSIEQIQKHIVDSFEVHKERSKHEWQLDISLLEKEPYNIKLTPFKERIFEVKKYKKRPKKKKSPTDKKKIHPKAKIAAALKPKATNTKRPPKK